MAVNRAYRSQTIYPVALWLNGSEIVRAFWGITKTHAFHRAERWGNQHHPNIDRGATMTTTISDADERRINIAVTQLAAVEQLHHRSQQDGVAHECAMGECEHEEAARGDECPTFPVDVCACCFGHLNLDDETTIPRWALWPCATAKAFGAVA